MRPMAWAVTGLAALGLAACSDGDGAGNPGDQNEVGSPPADPSVPPAVSGDERFAGTYNGYVFDGPFYNPMTSVIEQRYSNHWMTFTRSGYVVLLRLPRFKVDWSFILAKKIPVYSYAVTGGRLELVDAQGKAHSSMTYERKDANTIILDKDRYNREDLGYNGMVLKGTFTHYGGIVCGAGAPDGCVSATREQSLTFADGNRVTTNTTQAVTSYWDNDISAGSLASWNQSGPAAGTYSIADNQIVFRWDGGKEQVADFCTEGSATADPPGIFVFETYFMGTGEPPPAVDCKTCSSGSVSSSGACASTGAACAKDAGCAGLLVCLSKCASGDKACGDACVAQYSAGVNALKTLLVCVCKACSTECASSCT